MTTLSRNTIYVESFLRKNADLFEPHLVALGLDKKLLESTDEEMPFAQYVELMEYLGKKISPTIGLELGVKTTSNELGIYGHVIRCAPTMQQALKCLSHFVSVLAQGVRVDIEVKDAALIVEYQVTDQTIRERRQDAELSLGIGLSLIREITGQPNLCPIRVEFEHDAPADLSIYEKLLGCSLLFNQQDNRLCFPASLLDAPVVTTDTRLFQALEPFLEQQRQRRAPDMELVEQLAHHIASSLSGGVISLELVAASMKIGVRTLQRRLAEQGLGFSHLVEDVRKSLAQNYVASSHYSLTEIALLLGYSETSSFSRAFRRWTKRSPIEFRRDKRG